jgi:repressor LexA
MHPIQEKLLKLAKEKNLGEMTLREMGSYIGEESPQKIKHHLNQLEIKGLIKIDKIKGIIEKTQPGWAKGLLDKAIRILSIPIVGTANCGPARLFAETNFEGFLKVSSKLIGRNNANGIFAIKADGPSMNRAEVDGKRIEDGDYLIIDSNDKDAHTGDIVLSIIDNMANIKRFVDDRENNQIILISASTQNFAPIHIHPDDNYIINGKVINVIKKPQNKK